MAKSKAAGRKDSHQQSKIVKKDAPNPKIVKKDTSKDTSKEARNSRKAKHQKQNPARETPAVSTATKRKAEEAKFSHASHAGHAKRNRKMSEIDEELLAENERRFQDQRKRSLYVSLPGKSGSVTESALKALHPDILNVHKLSHSAFLIFSSEAVRDKAFPIIEKAQLKNRPVKVDYCCEKSKTLSSKNKKPLQHKGLNLRQLVVSDLPKDADNNVLEIVFPKSNDIKVIKPKQLAYVNFENETDALEAFKKGKVLKITSVPVMVRYRYVEPTSGEIISRSVEDIEDEVIPTLVDENAKPLTIGKKGKQVVEVSDDEVDSDSDALNSGEEGFEEVFEEIEVEGSDFEEGEGFEIQSSESSDAEE